MRKLPRFFAPGRLSPGMRLQLRGSDARKVSVVLRMRSGDAIELCDSGARRFGARIELRGRTVYALVQEEQRAEAVAAPKLRVTVAQAIPKGAKMDFVVEKLTELGVIRILPLRTERVVAGSEARIERWRRLARNAAQQCGRDDIPVVSDPLTFAQMLTRSGEYDRFLLPWELAEPIPLRDVLPDLLREARTALVAIGPEGGFSQDEAELARAAGAVPVSLGRRILRTETAALALVATMNFLLEA